MLEKKADERWGKDPEYIKYKRETPVLVPFTCGTTSYEGEIPEYNLVDNAIV